MKKVTIKSQSDDRVLKIMSRQINGVSYKALSAALRKKDVLIGGIRINQNVLAEKNSEITVFLPENAFRADFSVFYEDRNIIVVNKNKGIEVCDGEYNLLDRLRENSPAILPVHRLDRNTSGLCMFAKTEQAFSCITDALKNKRIRKFYRAEVAAVPHADKGVFVDYMVKDAAASMVKVYSAPAPGRKKTVTSFRLLYPTESGAMLEVEISDGFTHQIRASLAFHGMPIIGDGKYGNARLNRKTGFRYQRLAAFKLVFDFEKSSPLAYLNNAKLQIADKDINL